MNPHDESDIPTAPLKVAGAGAPPQEEPLTDSGIGAALGAGSSKLPHGEWVSPTPAELQRDFPQYEIRGILGRGGMGAVYKGWQRSLDRLVAIKILPPGLDDGISDFTERFKREAKAMAHLQHPGIVTVHDAGETREGLLYFIMECVEGTDLQQLVNERKRLDPGEALRITSDVCDALAYAHAHGVIHRDIKPSNIMLDARGTVKVADFGLAKSTAPETTVLTVSNITMGTPDFMAPEALHGVAHVDHRADIYALGVMLYQTLTGKLPRGKFDPPSRVVPGLDKRLDRIVDRALQPEPAARYADALEMRNAIAPIARSTAKRMSASSGAAASRKSPAVLVLVSVALAALVALFKFGPRITGGGPRRVTPQASADESGKTTGGLPSTTPTTAPFVNTLGQEFVPVPGTPALFCRWETRVRDYTVFAKATKADEAWTIQEKERVPVSRAPEEPVVGVSWDDANAFCEWLTKKESADGQLPKGMRYRLPTDEEWSRAVGLAREDGATPKERSGKNAVDFPWGKEFPPPNRKAGNYADSAYREKFPKEQERAIEGYDDGFATTAPVGSFAANAYGIFDLGGNVWEWCENLMEPGSTRRVVRGASWGHFARDGLLSSCRRGVEPDTRLSNYGFRCVLAPPSTAPATAAARAAAMFASATDNTPFVNTLGQEFVPVPGTQALFCRWDTRVRDFAEYARVNILDGVWMTQHQDGVAVSRELEYPAVGVSWDDANAFCAWLTAKENAEGKLPKPMRYRLPTDEEWSCAVGLAQESGATPKAKNEKGRLEFPWGREFPPAKGKAGNYADAAFHEKFPKETNWIEGYADDYATTSPVGSFPPNAHGLYDMGGNVWQWCADAWEPGSAEHVLRGAAWNSYDRASLLSSSREHAAHDCRSLSYGFRCVVELPAR